MYLCATVTVVTSQTFQACLDANEAVAANHLYLNALLQVGQSLDNDAAINNEQLDNFCSSNCRALID